MKNILFLFLFIPLISIGQATIKGTVTDSFNSPLPGASIYNSSYQKSSTSNKIGTFDAFCISFIRVRELLASPYHRCIPPIPSEEICINISFHFFSSLFSLLV